MNDRQRINIAMAFNSRFVRYAYVTLTSLFCNKKPSTDIYVYILQSDLTMQDKVFLDTLANKHGAILHYFNIDRSSFPEECPLSDVWSIEIYYRLMLPDLLADDVDRLLYLDADIIINQDLSELYFTDFEGNMLCACPDPCAGEFGNAIKELFKSQIEQGHQYFNSGVLLFNMSQMRKKYVFSDYLKLAEERKYNLLAPDQDLLNFMHFAEVKFLDPIRYNLFSILAYHQNMDYNQAKQSLIIHYAGRSKPWNGNNIHYKIEQIWWDYACKTPFYSAFLEEFQRDMMHNRTVPNMLHKQHVEIDVLHQEIQSLHIYIEQLRQELTKSAALCQKLAKLIQ